MDTSVLEAPGVAPQTLSESGSWLCGRHPKLVELVQQIGAWENDAPVMWLVRDSVIEFDRIAAMAATAHAVGAIFRPRRPDMMAMAVMSPSEVGRLRLLATLAPPVHSGIGVQFCASDLEGFDRVGKELIQDWLRAVRIGILG